MSSKTDEIRSQNTAILQALKDGKRITAMYGVKHFGSTRVGARIYDLRKMGHPIVSRMVRTPNGKRVAEYSLAA